MAEPETTSGGKLPSFRCPKTKAELVLVGDRFVSRDAATRLAYPIEGGIPCLRPERGEALAEDEWRRLLTDAGVAVDG